MDKGKLKRGGQVLLPSLFTMGNMACGFFSLLASEMGDFTSAATAVIVGILFDMLDGRIARMVHGESSFGIEFDSLADFLTFGVAPGYMMYAFTLKDYGVLGGVLAFLFALGGGLRLARFNVVAQSGKGSKSHFQGLPIPAGGGFLAAFVLLYEKLEEGSSSHPLSVLMDQLPWLIVVGPLMMAALAGLMVSTIPYAAFKQSKLIQRPDFRLVAIAGAALVLMYLYPQNSLFLVFAAYVLSGFLGLLGRAGKAEADHGDPRPASSGSDL